MSLARGIAISTLGNFIPPLAALATQPILAHALGVAGRGEVAAATAPVLLGIVVLGLGVPESLTHFVARRAPLLRRTARWSMVVLTVSGTVGTAVIAAFSGPLSSNDNELARLMLIASSALIPALIVGGLRGIAAGRQAWGLVAIERGSSAIIRLVAIAVLAALGALDVLRRQSRYRRRLSSADSHTFSSVAPGNVVSPRETIPAATFRDFTSMLPRFGWARQQASCIRGSISY
jgi:O-antigen/teichoic acid export membrane protein